MKVYVATWCDEVMAEDIRDRDMFDLAQSSFLVLADNSHETIAKARDIILADFLESNYPEDGEYEGDLRLTRDNVLWKPLVNFPNAGWYLIYHDDKGQECAALFMFITETTVIR